MPVVVNSVIDWDQAAHAAREQGGYLATITSPAENSFIFGLIQDPKYWNGVYGPILGGYQPPGSTEPGGGWTWVTGEPWDYANWSGGQPDNGDNPSEDGLTFLNGGVWNDKRTNDASFVSYIVERDATTFDLSRDFSILRNPNGPWSYGWKSILAGEFTLLTVPRSYFSGPALTEDWVLANNQVPVVMCNVSSNTFDNGQAYFPPGTVAVSAGFDGWPQNYCVVRFTAPSSGAYRLENGIESRLYGPASKETDFHVLLNGVQIHGTNLPPNSKSTYANEIQLSTGDVVDFICGRGPSGVFDTGLKISARLTPTVCTPHKAKAAAQIVNGFVVGATLTDLGCGYTNPPAVLIKGGGGSGAVAQAVISNGVVVAIQILNAGFSYENAPTILIASPPFVPKVGIKVRRIEVNQEVVLGWKYVLETSTNSLDWTATGPAFVAEDESLSTEFDVDAVGRFFRLRVVP